MKRLVAAVAVALLALTACAESGSTSSGTSSNGSSSNGSSSNNGTSNNGGSSNNGTSDGSSNNGGSNNDGSSNNGGSSPGTTPGSTGTTPPNESIPPPPAGYTLPEPEPDGDTVKVPDKPPKEIRNDSPRKRLSELPPIPRSCLDDDLTLLDVFAPFVSVPLRLMYCLLYIGTVARLPSEVNATIDTPVLSRSGERVTAPVGLLPPERNQRPLATLALILLVIVVAVAIGYLIGRRRAER